MKMAALVAAAVFLTSGVPSPARGQACKPSAVVKGYDAALVHVVQEGLRARGVLGAVTGACPGVLATVERAAGGVRVDVLDPYGRLSRRHVTDEEGATTVIESWARPGFSEALRSDGASPREASARSPGEDAPPALSKAPVDQQPATPSLWRGGGAAEASLALDGSLWLGGAVFGCRKLGPTCTGLLGRLAYDTSTVGASASLQTQRHALDVYLSSDFPIAVGRGQLSAGLGVGAGWMQTTRGIDGGSVANAQVELNRAGARVNAHVVLSWPVIPRVAVDLGVHGDLLLRAHTGVFGEEESMTLAGEPLAFLRAALGLRFGAAR